MASARLLDLTRLVSRLGKGPMTGVDRVEAAYLAEFLRRDAAVFGLVRSAVGFLLLDRAAMMAIHDGSLDLGRNDLIGRIAYRNDHARAHAEAALRRLAVARCWRGGLAAMLCRHLSSGGSYFNTGHANLDNAVFRQVHDAGLKRVVLMHDSIPLDHPEMSRPDTIATFRKKMQVVALQADLVVHTCRVTRAGNEAQLARLGRIPEGLVAPLGVQLPQPLAAALPFAPASPYFVCLGTIEPRKNHTLLLDVWSRLPDPAPALYIVGRRGWPNAETFARLDALPSGSPVHEMAGLDDATVSTLLRGASGLLFPSRAEGYGLPAIEAATLGIPLIVSDLPVFHETLREFAVYLDPDDRYSWRQEIERLARAPVRPRARLDPPKWQEHFNIVLSRA